MRGARRAGAALLTALGVLAACGRGAVPASAPGPAPAAANGVAAAPPPAVAAAPSDPRRTVDVPAVAGRPALRIVAEGAADPSDDTVLAVQALDVRLAADGSVVQRLEGLDTRTPVVDGEPLLEQPDLDFDGMPDLRIVADRPAGPNVPYRHWRYDKVSARFVAVPALDELAAPQFEAARREVRSDWRDGAARHGTDRYAWRDGALVPLSRTVWQARGPGAATERRYRWSGQDWVPER